MADSKYSTNIRVDTLVLHPSRREFVLTEFMELSPRGTRDYRGLSIRLSVDGEVFWDEWITLCDNHRYLDLQWSLLRESAIAAAAGEAFEECMPEATRVRFSTTPRTSRRLDLALEGADIDRHAAVDRLAYVKEILRAYAAWIEPMPESHGRHREQEHLHVLQRAVQQVEATYESQRY